MWWFSIWINEDEERMEIHVTKEAKEGK